MQQNVKSMRTTENANQLLGYTRVRRIACAQQFANLFASLSRHSRAFHAKRTEGVPIARLGHTPYCAQFPQN
jgi:hypothetical protein